MDAGATVRGRPIVGMRVLVVVAIAAPICVAGLIIAALIAGARA